MVLTQKRGAPEGAPQLGFCSSYAGILFTRILSCVVGAQFSCLTDFYYRACLLQVQRMLTLPDRIIVCLGGAGHARLVCLDLSCVVGAQFSCLTAFHYRACLLQVQRMLTLPDQVTY